MCSVYSYPRFRRAFLAADLAFHCGPVPGKPVPASDLLTTNGDHVHKEDFVGPEPLLLLCALVIRPMVASAASLLRRLHRELGGSLYWNNKRSLREVLRVVATGRQRLLKERQRRAIPVLRGLGVMDETLRFAGQQARRDVRWEMLALYVLVRRAAAFQPLPPLGRSIAGIT